MSQNFGSAETFHSLLRKKIDLFVHSVYDATCTFPKSELFGATSQLRRAALSVALNYIEGSARRRKAVLKNFLEISYGSLKESEYLMSFSFKRNWINEKAYANIRKLGDEIGAMLWKTICAIQ